MKEVLQMSFTESLGIRKSSNPDYLVEIEFTPKHANHLGYFHASVIFSFAEICSGCFLAKYFPEEKETTLPMLRKVDGKFSSPANGKLFAKAHLHNDSISEVSFRLNMTDKVQFTIVVDVFNEQEKLVYRGNFNWFVRRKIGTNPKSIVKALGEQ